MSYKRHFFRSKFHCYMPKGREGANHCSPEGGGTVGDGQRYPYAAESWVRCTSSVSSASLHGRYYVPVLGCPYPTLRTARTG